MNAQRRGGRVLAIGVGLLVAAGTLTTGTATAAPAGDGLAEFHRQPVEWSACTGEGLEGLECATIVVPLDYTDPGGDRIEVAISRSTATDPERRRGILLLNPGGPGGAGRMMPNLYVGQPISEIYDLVGFDPRGVAASTALNCSVPEGSQELPSRPTDAELRLFTEYARATEEGCDRMAGALRPYISTANTARDMDVVRAVLGEERINYVGYSYGTYLGAVYGSLFPERLDRSVLDSSVHPDRIWRETWLAMAPAYTENVQRFAEWAAERDGGYGLGGTAEEVRATIEEIAAALHEEPVEGVDRTVFDLFVGVQGRWQAEWDLFAELLLALEAGDIPASARADAAAAVRLAVAAAREELAPGTFYAVRCEADWPGRLGPYYQAMREYRTEHPYGTGVFSAAPDPCTFRSFTPPEPPVELERDGYPAGLVIQAEYDPQTAYEGGPAMARRLRGNLIIVTDDGGHGYFGLHGDGYGCVNDRVNRYLVHGVLPPSASTCPGLPAADVPADDEQGAARRSAPRDLAERMAEAIEDRGGLPLSS
ncbi:alpha/beta hydrolase [Allonocardiopsis opalescens]|uniref:TAP-like protein n=1 Tax=Allonocardiopsis opalescens TaxID=1144618 RepID=A0A2T0QFM9_9ACTN|nr:alpha/beta hydrolase [Allonocardiopsis opalescens]PRY02737.1 TAP-like protein [Allonocardiopsis opalescens]